MYYNHDILMGSSDTIFIGSQNAIDYLFNLSDYFKNKKVYHDTIWENTNFLNYILEVDSCLAHCRATYSPEMQYIAHIFFSQNFKYENLRVDYNNNTSIANNTALYNVRHDPNRYNY